MFEKFFRRRTEYINVEEAPQNHRKRNLAVIAMIVAAVCVLCFGGGSKKENGIEKAAKVSDAGFDFEQYKTGSEERLRTILSEVRGAGKVEVMLSFETMNEKVLATNSKNENASDVDGEKRTSTRDREESILVYGSGSGEQPFVLKEILPVPSGAIILAAGAGEEKVRLEIYEAVKALYGISGHRIKVAQLMDK